MLISIINIVFQRNGNDGSANKDIWGRGYALSYDDCRKYLFVAGAAFSCIDTVVAILSDCCGTALCAE